MRASGVRAGLKAMLMLAPLLVLLGGFLIVPLGSVLWRSVANPEVRETLPLTLQALSRWDGQEPVPEAAAKALGKDLAAARKHPGQAGRVARRLERVQPGLRSLLMKTANRAAEADGKAPGESSLEALSAIDARWAKPGIWRIIRQNRHTWTSDYFRQAVDLAPQEGSPVSLESGTPLRLAFWHTLEVASLSVLLTLLVAYPFTYWAAGLSSGTARALVLLALFVPLWTPTLVRDLAWIAILQNSGVANGVLLALGWISHPLSMLHTRGAYLLVSLHVLLPFMVFPLYAAMRSVPPVYQQAAMTLGSSRLGAFFRAYLPHTYVGAATGALLVFIASLSYYVTPKLVGGHSDQLVSYFISYYTGQTVNWGLASALGVLLTLLVLAVFWLYWSIVRRLQTSMPQGGAL